MVRALLPAKTEEKTVSKRFPITDGSSRHHASGPSGKSGKSKNHGQKPRWNPQFIAIDGEGYTDDEGNHHYILMASSMGHTLTGTLTTERCFEWLLSIKREYPKHILVCFGAGYDINMMFKGTPIDVMTRIWNGPTVERLLGNRNVWVKYTQRKSLQLSHWVNDAKQGLTLYDCFGFFQTSFVQAIREWLGGDYEELGKISEGKSRRSQFRAGEYDFILDYCRAELRALVKLMDAVVDSLRAADIRIGAWYGPGAIASALLKKHKISEHRSDTFHQYPGVYLAARHAYAGGRIELLQYGYTERELYHYDINSAYPAVIATLPSLAGITWKHFTADSTDWKLMPPFSLISIRWAAKEEQPFYPFFYRTVDGRIYYPPIGRGWYWKAEIDALLPYFRGSVKAFECWAPSPLQAYAFSWMRDLYDQRRRWKAEGNAAHKTLKLGLNSIYGKLIQHVGGDEKTQTLPAFHQLEWAGFITASTRAKLYTAAMQRPDAIVSFQTDGIISTEPLDLDIGDGLGQWTEEKRCIRGLFVQSGIYWIWEQDGGIVEHYRGFDNGSLSPERILTGYKRGASGITAPSTRFVTVGSAIANRWEHWCSWRTIDRELQLTPKGSKRADIDPDNHPDRGLVRTRAAEGFKEFPLSGISQPYALPWDKWELRGDDIIDGVAGVQYYGEQEDTWL